MVQEATTQQTTEEPEKNEIVCPVSLKFGAVQNFRCTWRKREGLWESRPVRGTDSWAEEFFSYVHKSKEDGGLGLPDANAIKFTHEDGKKAREKAIQMVNEGDLRAPKKGWDDKFVPQGGIPKKDLKVKYPEMYESQSRKKETAASQNGEDRISDEKLVRKDLDEEMEDSDKAEILSSEELHDIHNEHEGVEEEEHAYAAEAVADLPFIEKTEDGYKLQIEFTDLPMVMRGEIGGKPVEVTIRYH